MPLPFTINAWIMGKYYERRQYLGHGKSKVCYWLTETLVLKLRDESDQEPHLFRELQATGVYPRFTHQLSASLVVRHGTRG